MLQLRKATIVILAQNHNPSIISPDWIRANLAIEEKPTNFVHTPPFSLFDSRSFTLTVDADRWELLCKAMDEDNISLCGQAATNYLKMLPHVPLKKLGMNYIWAYTVDSTIEHLPQLALEINGAYLEELLKGQNIRYGGIVRVKFKDHDLNLTIDYEAENTCTFNYNYSYDIANLSRSKVSSAVKSFPMLKTRSNELTSSILTRKGM